MVNGRSALLPADLTTAEREVVASAQTGSWWRADTDASFGPVAPRGVDDHRRVIRAQVLYQLMTGHGELSLTADGDVANVRAIRVWGARIAGSLNIMGLTVRCPVEFIQCDFPEAAVKIQGAAFPYLSLRGSRIPKGVLARQVRTRGDLDLRRVKSDGPFDLALAKVAGALLAQDARFRNVGRDALTLVGATVDGGILAQGMRCAGRVNFGDVTAAFLNLDGSHIENPGNEAFLAEGMRLRGNLLARSGYRVSGFMSLRKINVEGSLVLDASEVSNPGGVCLDLANSEVDGDLTCRSGFRSSGMVEMLGATIGGALIVSGGRFENEGDVALRLDRANIGGSLLGRAGFSTSGAVFAIDTVVGSELGLDGCQLSNPGSWTVKADRIKVGSSLFFRAQASSMGSLEFANADIGGSAVFEECELSAGPETAALDLRNASIGTTLRLVPSSRGAVIDLRGASTSVYVDDSVDQSRCFLQGFSYVTALPEPPVRTLADRLDWIARDPDGYAPGPYGVLADALRKRGHSEAAKRTLIQSQWVRRQGRSGFAGAASRLWSSLLRWTVGYGYRPSLAVAWLVVLVVAGAGVVSRLPRASFTPSAGAPRFNSLFYTVDQMIPFVDLGYSRWTPSGVAQTVTVVIVLLGWLLVTALLAALSGVLRRGD